MKVSRTLGSISDVEEQVEAEMKNIKVEVQKDGKWVDWNEGTSQ